MWRRLSRITTGIALGTFGLLFILFAVLVLWGLYTMYYWLQG